MEAVFEEEYCAGQTVFEKEYYDKKTYFFNTVVSNILKNRLRFKLLGSGVEIIIDKYPKSKNSLLSSLSKQINYRYSQFKIDNTSDKFFDWLTDRPCKHPYAKHNRLAKIIVKLIRKQYKRLFVFNGVVFKFTNMYNMFEYPPEIDLPMIKTIEYRDD